MPTVVTAAIKGRGKMHMFIRLTMMGAVAMTLAACSRELSKQSDEREVNLDRAAAFRSLMEETHDSSQFTKVSSGSSTRYESEINRSDPRWSSRVGGGVFAFAETYKRIVDATEPTEIVMTQQINGDDIVSGVRMTLEDLDGSRTRVRYEITPASGPRAKDFEDFVNSCQLAGILAGLGKLNHSRTDAEKAEESEALDRCNSAGRALETNG